MHVFCFVIGLPRSRRSVSFFFFLFFFSFFSPCNLDNRLASGNVEVSWNGGRVGDNAIYRGGAVKISGSTSRFSFEHVVFEGNRQTDNIALDRFDEYTHSGAALASGPSTVVDLSFANCSFLGNAARKYAGAVYLGAKTKSAVFDSCIFRGNTALLGGDDVYVKDGVGEGAVKIVDAVGLFFFLFFIWSALYALRYTEKTYSLMPLLPIIHNSSVTHQHFSVFSSVCFLSCFVSLSLFPLSAFSLRLFFTDRRRCAHRVAGANWFRAREFSLSRTLRKSQQPLSFQSSMRESHWIHVRSNCWAKDGQHRVEASDKVVHDCLDVAAVIGCRGWSVRCE